MKQGTKILKNGTGLAVFNKKCLKCLTTVNKISFLTAKNAEILRRERKGYIFNDLSLHPLRQPHL
jgi:hypothetical protein